MRIPVQYSSTRQIQIVAILFSGERYQDIVAYIGTWKGFAIFYQTFTANISAFRGMIKKLKAITRDEFEMKESYAVIIFINASNKRANAFWFVVLSRYLTFDDEKMGHGRTIVLPRGPQFVITEQAWNRKMQSQQFRRGNLGMQCRVRVRAE